MSRHDVKSQRWPLLEAGFAPGTIKKYRPAVHRFLNWCHTTGSDAQTDDDLDELLADYFQQHHTENGGKGKSLAAVTLAGIRMYLPRLKTPSLPTASAVCARWNKSKPPVSYPPLTWDLTVVIALQLIRGGHFRFGVATLVGFHCLLRVGELTSLRREHFADHKDARLGAEYRKALVSIEKAKTGRYQSVTVDDPVVRQLLSDIVAKTKPGARLFPGGADGYRKAFKSACASLGLSEKYVPHSLRHGGATRMHIAGVPIADILIRGRWKSTESAKTYIKMGPALLMAMSAPEAVAKAAAVLAKDVALSVTLAQKHKV